MNFKLYSDLNEKSNDANIKGDAKGKIPLGFLSMGGEAGYKEAILPLNDTTYEGMARGIVKDMGGRETINYGMMADAILQALISYGFKIEVDKRQFGRLVTEVYEV